MSNLIRVTISLLALWLGICPAVAQQTTSTNPGNLQPPSPPPPPPPPATTPIQHIIRINMENRTFDHYFGQYGLATQSGTSTSGSATLQLTNVSALHVGDYL